MINLGKRYRQDYAGEDIITERTLENNVWTSVTEFVPNNIINNQISNRAVVFGNGPSRLQFPVDHVLKHKSGPLGALTMQSYGCNAFYRDHKPDFLVVTDRLLAKEMLDNTFYANDNIVYSRAMITLEFPGKFYLIPHDIYTDAGNTAIYLACFDGHKTVYLVGFDIQDTPNFNYNVYAGTNCYDPIDTQVGDSKWINDRIAIMNTYDDVDFVWVTKYGTCVVPEPLQYVTNFRQINFRQWVLEADL